MKTSEGRNLRHQAEKIDQKLDEQDKEISSLKEELKRNRQQQECVNENQAMAIRMVLRKLDSVTSTQGDLRVSLKRREKRIQILMWIVVPAVVVSAALAVVVVVYAEVSWPFIVVMTLMGLLISLAYVAYGWDRFGEHLDRIESGQKEASKFLKMLVDAKVDELRALPSHEPSNKSS